ncbi:hypothetical protein HDN1F_35530 [gamma proteobacterium HdN1]|nr:Hypothetical protein HDN1F_17660 [gamma proteobacterium HdN1]CBL47136.1 hypothetical protein HDN1F_35530 [gamma proteobacterium HdN1]
MKNKNLKASNPASRGHALKQFIDSMIQSLPTGSSKNSHSDDQFGLVYLGNVHDSIPRLLVLDQSLRLEERCVWQVMRVGIHDPARPASLLKQSELAEQCSVDTKTIRRYLHALRATRWITRCAMVHGRGTVWALHDEPLSLADTQLLDPGYLQFINECARSKHKRLQDLGQSVLDMLEADIAYGHDSSQPATQIEQAAKRLDALAKTPRKTSSGSFFAAFPGSQSDQKRSNFERREIFPVDNSRTNFPITHLSTGKISLSSQDKFPYGDNLSCSSSKNNKYIYKNTTTTNTDLDKTNTREDNFSSTDKLSSPSPKFQPPQPLQPPHWADQLNWPKALREREKQHALAILTSPQMNLESAQFLLNYLSDRLTAAQRGEAKPLSNCVAYLSKLAEKHRSGDLQPSSWGLREIRQPAAIPVEFKPTTPEKRDPHTREVALKNLAELRQKVRLY